MARPSGPPEPRRGSHGGALPMACRTFPGPPSGKGACLCRPWEPARRRGFLLREGGGRVDSLMTGAPYSVDAWVPALPFSHLPSPARLRPRSWSRRSRRAARDGQGGRGAALAGPLRSVTQRTRWLSGHTPCGSAARVGTAGPCEHGSPFGLVESFMRIRDAPLCCTLLPP